MSVGANAQETNLIMGSLTGALLHYAEAYCKSNSNRFVSYKPLKLSRLEPQKKENTHGK